MFQRAVYFSYKTIITISLLENETIISGKEVDENMHVPSCASHLIAFCNSIAYSSVSGFRSIHCVIICSSREIDENVNTLKQYLISSDKTQYFLFLQMTKIWNNQYQSLLTQKKMHIPAAQSALVLICDLK